VDELWSGANALGLKVGRCIEKADKIKTHNIGCFWVSRIDWNQIDMGTQGKLVEVGE